MIIFDAKKYLFEDRREEKEGSNRRRRRRRRRRKRKRQYVCTRRLYIYYRESKNLFRLEGSNSVSPPLPSGKCRDLVSEEEKLYKFYLKFSSYLIENNIYCYYNHNNLLLFMEKLSPFVQNTYT